MVQKLMQRLLFCGFCLLVTAQIPGTPFPPDPLPYPPGASANNTPAAATNPWQNANLTIPPLDGDGGSLQSRDISDLDEDEEEAMPLLERRAGSAPNPAYLQVASMNFSAWQGGPAANSPAFMTTAKVRYWVALAANVNIKTVYAWGLKPVNAQKRHFDVLSYNGKSDKTLGKQVNTNGNSTLTTTMLTFQNDDDYDMHLYIVFWWGQPHGNISIFADTSTMKDLPKPS